MWEYRKLNVGQNEPRWNQQQINQRIKCSMDTGVDGGGGGSGKVGDRSGTPRELLLLDLSIGLSSTTMSIMVTAVYWLLLHAIFNLGYVKFKRAHEIYRGVQLSTSPESIRPLEQRW